MKTTYHDGLEVGVRGMRHEEMQATQVQCACGQFIRTPTPLEAQRVVIKCPRCGGRNLLTWGSPESVGMDPQECLTPRDLVVDSFEGDDGRTFIAVRTHLESITEISRGAALMGGPGIKEMATRAAVNHLEERIYGAVRKRGLAMLKQIDVVRHRTRNVYDPGLDDALRELQVAAYALQRIGFEQPEEPTT